MGHSFKGRFAIPCSTLKQILCSYYLWPAGGPQNSEAPHKMCGFSGVKCHCWIQWDRATGQGSSLSAVPLNKLEGIMNGYEIYSKPVIRVTVYTFQCDGNFFVFPVPSFQVTIPHHTVWTRAGQDFTVAYVCR